MSVSRCTQIAIINIKYDSTKMKTMQNVIHLKIREGYRICMLTCSLTHACVWLPYFDSVIITSRDKNHLFIANCTVNSHFRYIYNFLNVKDQITHDRR